MKKVLFVLILTLAALQFALAQDEDEVIKVETSLVLVPVSVSDEQGRFLPALKREDFRLFEDGKEQEIAHFDTVDAPFTVVLMLDLSDSARFKLSEIQEAAIAFADGLRPTDRVALFVFDKNVIKALDATANRTKIREAIRDTRTGGGTSLYVAVGEVSKYLGGVRGRKAMVIFSDGIDTTSGPDENFVSTLRAAQETDALVFPIQYDTTDLGYTGSPSRSEPNKHTQKLGMPTKTIVTTRGEFLNIAYKRGTQYFNLLANTSGGKFQFADSVGDLAVAFAKIAQELKEQYTLGFYPPNQTADGKQHDLKVQLKNSAKTKLRYRRGYVGKSVKVKG